MRVFLVIFGGILGASFAFGSLGMFGAILGALVGFAIGDLARSRSRIFDLEKEVEALRKEARTGARSPVAGVGARSSQHPDSRCAVAPEEPGFEASGSEEESPYSPSSGVGARSSQHPDSTPAVAPEESALEGLDTESVDPAASTATLYVSRYSRVSDGRPYAAREASSHSGPAAPEAPSHAPRAGDSEAAGGKFGAQRTPNDTASSQSSASSRSATSTPSGAKSPPPSNELPLVKAIRDYFTGGNTLVRVGIVILFIGVAFLLRYVAEHTHVPIELRLSGVAIGAVVLLALGWRLRKKRLGYALTLQGGAIGILYLTVFAALRLFHVMGPGPAFAILVILAAFSAALAILQDSMALALLAISFGFLAPVMASTGEGNHVILFSYYAILNLGILAIAWFKAWRPLNVVGFLFTFVIGTSWGVLKYRPEFFPTTEPFLIAFFILYVAIAVLFSIRQRPALRGYVDGTIVFGVPVVAFGLQAAMVHDWPFASAYSALAVSAIYLLLAWALHRGRRDTQRMLVEAFMALGIAFLTLAVPLALDGRWSSATWALEGAALVWIGCRQQRRLPRAFGSLLQLASGVIFMSDLLAPRSGIPVLNSACLGGVMIAVASVFAAHSLLRAREKLSTYELPFAPVLFFWGLIWWLIAGLTEIGVEVSGPQEVAWGVVFLSVTALISSEVHRRLDIAVARFPPLALIAVMVLYALLQVVNVKHPVMNGGWFAWPVAFALFYFLCRRHEGRDIVWSPRPQHMVSALLLIALLAWELSWQVDYAVRGGGSWPAIAWVLVPAVVLYLLPKLCARFSWPFKAHEETYVALVGAVLSAYLILWSVGTNLTMPGDPYPLPYVPVMNPLDLAHVFVLLVLARHGLHLQKAQYRAFSDFDGPQLMWLLAILTFIWLNAVLLRTMHHWAAIPYEPEALFKSTLVQTALTIFWTVLALGTMLFATRRSVRYVWIIGAVLMAVVIGKLFLIDLSRIGTVERIVSFVGVGVLMLVVGYFSPLPPSRKEATA